MRESAAQDSIRWLGLFGGPLLGALAYVLVPDTELAHAGRATLGLMAWMAVWWLTEAIDISATALLPIAALPLVTIAEFPKAEQAVAAAAAPYANPFIALFMGGFILALAMERWGLHKRIALVTLRFVGTRPANIVGGIMAITALISMWVSNTSTTAMMLPIALSVSGLLSEAPTAGDKAEARRGPSPSNFAVCLMLGVAYAASIGGMGTLIGTPPNTMLAAFLDSRYGIEITFARWLGIGLPIVVVFIPLTWILLTRVLYPLPGAPLEGAHELMRGERERLGPVKRGEWITFVVFMVTALSWIFRPLIARIAIAGHHPLAGLTDAGLAMIAALALFVIPIDLKERTFVMNWEWAKRLPWGILVLFGGGLSLAAAVERHGAADYLGRQVEALAGLPPLVIIVVIAAAVIFLGELTSNTATVATLLPILAGVAPSLGVDPLLLLVPATVAASCSFMLPVGTPPNAIVFGTGHITMGQMCKAGLWLDLLGVALVTALAYALVLPVLASASR